MVDLTSEEVLKVLYQLSAVPFHSPMSTSGGQPEAAYNHGGESTFSFYSTSSREAITYRQPDGEILMSLGSR